MHLAAITYSLFLICFTSVRTIFAIGAHPVSPITTDILTTFAFPRTACSKMTSKSSGILKKISVNLISAASTLSGAHPLTAPNTIATIVDISVAKTPINREILPPYQIMEKISRPIVSVPNKNSRPGASLQCIRSI